LLINDAVVVTIVVPAVSIVVTGLVVVGDSTAKIYLFFYRVT